MKDLIVDIGASVTSFVTDVLGKSSIPGLSLGSLIIKRGIQTYEANQYLKNEGIKDLVVFKHMCDNLEVLVSRQKKTDELNYVFKTYKGLRQNVDNILQIFSESLYSDVLKKAYDDYPGKDKQTEAIDKIIKLELIPSIVHFINTELKDKTFNSFVDIQLATFDNEKLHDVWVQMWQTKGFNLLYNSYSEFIDAQIKEHKSLLSGSGKLSKSNQDKLDALKKNMESWQLYMDTLSSFTQIEDIHLFLLNYKMLRATEERQFDIAKFARRYMVDPVKMENMINETIQSLEIYVDALLTLTRVNQTGGSGKTAPKSKSKSKSKALKPKPASNSTLTSTSTLVYRKRA